MNALSEGLTFSNMWEFYPCQINDRPFTIRFDTAIGKLAEDVLKQYPHIIELMIPCTEVTENGYPSNSEFERLNKIEDGFSCDAYNVRLIGTLTGDNCIRFVFCCDGAEEDVENIIKILMSGSQGVKFFTKVFRDDNFGYYYNMIAPSVYEINWIMNRKVCEQLEKQGEAFNEPRVIDFYCCFASEQYITKIADELSKQGFSECGRDKKEDGAYGLSLTFEGIPSFSWINETTNGIINLLEGTDGYFDGWGTVALKGGAI